MDALQSQAISNIDILRLSKRCKFLDFRLKRALMEFYKERVAPKKKLDKPYIYADLLKGLTRQLIFESTRLISQPEKHTSIQ